MVYQAEDRAKLRRQHSDLAIQLAMHGRWDDAVKVNRAIIDAFPQDAEAYNRLGKALAEVGNYSEAQAAYSKCLELDPHNTIARKNLNRLAVLGNLAEADAPHETGQRKLSPQMFIEEMGKTGVSTLIEPDFQVAAVLTSGDEVYLRAEDLQLLVETGQGQYVGKIEPRLAQRLLKFIEGGNRYVAAVTNIAESEVKIFIRETYQDPSQAGKLSFPAVGTGENFRPYVKERLLRQDGPAEDYYEDSDGDDWGQEDTDERAGSVLEIGAEAARDDFDSDEE